MVLETFLYTCMYVFIEAASFKVRHGVLIANIVLSFNLEFVKDCRVPDIYLGTKG